MELTKTNYVDKAENVVKNLQRDKNGNLMLTTSKIRNLLTMISGIYNDVIHEGNKPLGDDTVERIQYLKMRFAYEAGREKAKEKKQEKGKIMPVEDLIQQAKIWEAIDGIGRDREKCITFCRYMEAIVAYHKYSGGKEGI